MIQNLHDISFPSFVYFCTYSHIMNICISLSRLSCYFGISLFYCTEVSFKLKTFSNVKTQCSCTLSSGSLMTCTASVLLKANSKISKIHVSFFWHFPSLYQERLRETTTKRTKISALGIDTDRKPQDGKLPLRPALLR